MADLRVPTPSAAAECAVFDMVQVDDYMQAYKRRLRNALDNVFARYKNRAEKDKLSLQIYNPINQIYERRQRLIPVSYTHLFNKIIILSGRMGKGTVEQCLNYREQHS